MRSQEPGCLETRPQFEQRGALNGSMSKWSMEICLLSSLGMCALSLHHLELHSFFDHPADPFQLNLEDFTSVTCGSFTRQYFLHPFLFYFVFFSFLQTTIKVYAKCLRSDIEYKTLGITYQTTCREVVSSLLNKYRMRHRDPNLFYLTMEVTVRKAGLRTVLALDEEARPAALQSCHPRGDSKFALQMRRGGLVKIYDSVLMPGVSELFSSLFPLSATTPFREDFICFTKSYF